MSFFLNQIRIGSGKKLVGKNVNYPLPKNILDTALLKIDVFQCRFCANAAHFARSGIQVFFEAYISEIYKRKQPILTGRLGNIRPTTCFINSFKWNFYKYKLLLMDNT